MDNQQENPPGQEQPLSHEASLELIASMISQAKNDYYDSGISALLWGSVIIVCSLTGYINTYLHWSVLQYIWWLTVVAVVPQVIISIREKKDRGYTSHQGELVSGIWTSYAIAIFLFSFIDSTLQIRHDFPIYLTLFGIPTFATGLGRHFRPMIIGGLACWVLAIVSVYVTNRNAFFLLGGGAMLAWFIPGLILRRRYRNAKRQHV